MNKFLVLYSAVIGVLAIGRDTLATCTLNGETVPCDDVAVGATLFGLVFLLPMLLIGLIFVVLIVATVFWIMMIIDAAKNEKDNELVAWILVLVFVQFLGAIIYYFVRKRPRDRAHQNITHNQSK